MHYLEVSMNRSHDSKLIQNLIRKRDLLQQGDPRHTEIRPLLLILGGGMRGVSGAGTALGFILAGYGEVFDTVVGISTGAAIGAYFLGGTDVARLGISMYYNELAKNFISYTRRPIADVDFAEAVFRRTLDISAIQTARSDFYVGATGAHSGIFTFINAKTAYPDVVSSIKASVAIPGLYGQSVLVNGVEYIDGSFSPFPVDLIMHQFQPTDIVVITNSPQGRTQRKDASILERLALRVLMGKSPELRKRWLDRNQKWISGYTQLGLLAESEINAECFWLSGDVNLLTRNAADLKSAAEVSMAHCVEFLGADINCLVSLIGIQAG